MSEIISTITQICIVVPDVEAASESWAHVLGVEKAEIITVFPDVVLHFTHGKEASYKNCQVAKYTMDKLILELIQPGPEMSPWRHFLETRGSGVFHVCVFVQDRKAIYQKLDEIGAGKPYHVGYFEQGSYSYVACAPQLGIELSINNLADCKSLMDQLHSGEMAPLDELENLEGSGI